MDSKLATYGEEEVKRVIGVALLCSQASPMLRPSMSRVVAMLSGDAEVSAVTSRPGYLTDWGFNDLNSSTDVFEMKETKTSLYNSIASTSMVGNVEHSPVRATVPMLHDTEGG